jgi:hypothetical protein
VSNGKTDVPTFVLERVIPAAFNIADPDVVALHSRWAADAYHAVGIAWLGGVATDKGNMYSLVVADSAEDIARYCASLGIAATEFKVSEVKATLGPHIAMARDDPRYRPQRRL